MGRKAQLRKPAGKRTRGELPLERNRRARQIFDALSSEFPAARTALHHENPFQLLIATILSAQCTDERVNMVTPGLFRKYPGPKHFAAAHQADLEQEIRSTGFFRMKARNIILCSTAIMERHQEEVPRVMEELVALPGVGRKTANVVLGQAFGVAAGVVVDTHVQRLAQRMGFSSTENPEEIEKNLMEVFPQADWIEVGTLLILHGRKTCTARNPRCLACGVSEHCPSAGSFATR